MSNYYNCIQVRIFKTDFTNILINKNYFENEIEYLKIELKTYWDTPRYLFEKYSQFVEIWWEHGDSFKFHDLPRFAL